MAHAAPPPAAVPYDFRRPPWISEDRRAVLDGIHARLLPVLTQLLVAQVRHPVGLALKSVSQISYGEWRAGLASPCIGFIAPLEPRRAGEGLVIVEPPLALLLVDLLFGGPGDPGDRPAGLTPLEQTVLGHLVNRVLGTLQDGYREVAAFSAGPVRFEEIVEQLNIVERHERIYLLELELRIGEFAGGMSLCLPAALLARFVRGAPSSPAAVEEPPRTLLEAHVRAARLQAAVRLPGFQLSARDGAALAAGQVLETRHPFAGTVELHVDGRRLFSGALGRHQGHVGLRVLAPVSGGTPPSPRVMRRIETP